MVLKIEMTRLFKGKTPRTLFFCIDALSLLSKTKSTEAF